MRPKQEASLLDVETLCSTPLGIAAGADLQWFDAFAQKVQTRASRVVDDLVRTLRGNTNANTEEDDAHTTNYDASDGGSVVNSNDTSHQYELWSRRKEHQFHEAVILADHLDIVAHFMLGTETALKLFEVCF